MNSRTGGGGEVEEEVGACWLWPLCLTAGTGGERPLQETTTRDINRDFTASPGSTELLTGRVFIYKIKMCSWLHRFSQLTVNIATCYTELLIVIVKLCFYCLEVAARKYFRFKQVLCSCGNFPIMHFLLIVKLVYLYSQWAAAQLYRNVKSDNR